MRIIAGLGNPGSQYDNTRHNVGFMLVDRMAAQTGASFSVNSKLGACLAKTVWNQQEILLVKPLSFMNLSGEPIRAVLSYYRVPETSLIVVCDDLDQEPGAVKMRVGGGHGGHNGIRSLLQHLPSDKFIRIKIGIGKPNHKNATANWVLHRFSQQELDALEDHSFSVAQEKILDVLRHSPT